MENRVKAKPPPKYEAHAAHNNFIKSLSLCLALGSFVVATCDRCDPSPS